MRIIARSTLVAYYTKNPQSKVALFVGTHEEYDKIKDIQNI